MKYIRYFTVVILAFMPLIESYSEKITVIPGENQLTLSAPYFRDIYNTSNNGLLQIRIISAFMLTAGICIAGIWSNDIVSGKFKGGREFFKLKLGENLLWPHIAVEYLTSAGLVAGGIGLYTMKDYGLPLSMVALGALIYSGINSSGWVLASRDRLLYGIPIWFCLAGAIFSMIVLI